MITKSIHHKTPRGSACDHNDDWENAMHASGCSCKNGRPEYNNAFFKIWKALGHDCYYHRECICYVQFRYPGKSYPPRS